MTNRVAQRTVVAASALLEFASRLWCDTLVMALAVLPFLYCSCPCFASPPSETSPPRMDKDETKRSVLLMVNGRPLGRVTVLFTLASQTGQPQVEAVLVPVRPVMEALGWTVHYTSERENRKAGIRGADLQIIAPYELEYAREDLSPADRGKRAHPGIIVPLFDEPALVYSPQWNMGESLKAFPLPQRVEGQVYVPLTFLEKLVALLVTRIGETLGTEGHYFPSKTGILMSLAKAEGELRIRYIPNDVERPTDRKALMRP